MYNCIKCGNEPKIRRLKVDGNNDCYYDIICSKCSNSTIWCDSIIVAVQLWNAANFGGSIGGTSDDN